jgi:hypothetical protein
MITKARATSFAQLALSSVTQDSPRVSSARFEGQRVFDARNVRDALRQAEALGATDIVEVTSGLCVQWLQPVGIAKNDPAHNVM